MRAKAKREAPKRRGGSDRRSARDGAVRKARRSAAEATARRTRPAQGSTVGRETRSAKSSPHARPVQRSARPISTRQAKARAKARKSKAPKVIRISLTERLALRLASIDLRPRALLAKVPFVVLVIGTLGLGLALTLWLSTDSTERSYQLSAAREKTRLLQQQKEALERDVREAEAAPALAEAARKQGMIPTRDTAHLVQDPEGNWVVVGTPKPADGVPPAPLNTKLPEERPPSPKPAAPPEVPVRVQPDPGADLVPGRSNGPEALLRAPDGSSTVGGQHLPPAAPQVPGAPGGPLNGQFPGMLASPGLPVPGVPAQGLSGQAVPAQGLPMQGLPTPGLPMPTMPAPSTATVPAEVPIPIAGMPQAPAPVQLPAEIPVPVQPGPGPQVGVPALPGAQGPAPAVATLAGPPAVAAPGVAR
ncbi:hypothetical protein [Mycobacterium tilburgii]|uniref:hypothetical protein n=1 Tax=Mycobacterium tilburgii TaxID=44467 RepID=UPI0011846475|nr:hypothetical protein [Mycobacterium tilburgii]